MFLLRSIFWLSVVVALLPADPAKQETASVQKAAHPELSTAEAMDAARLTVSDMSGFCARNPEVCKTGSQALQVFTQKAKYGARLIYEWAAEETPATGDAGNMRREPAEDRAARNGASTAQTYKLSENSLTGPLNGQGLITGSAGKRRHGGGQSRDTLTDKDLIPAWGGPRGKVSA